MVGYVVEQRRVRCDDRGDGALRVHIDRSDSVLVLSHALICSRAAAVWWRDDRFTGYQPAAAISARVTSQPDARYGIIANGRDG